MRTIRERGAHNADKKHVYIVLSCARWEKRRVGERRRRGKMEEAKMGTKAEDVYVTQFSDRLAPGGRFPFSALLLPRLYFLYLSIRRRRRAPSKGRRRARARKSSFTLDEGNLPRLEESLSRFLIAPMNGTGKKKKSTVASHFSTLKTSNGESANAHGRSKMRSEIKRKEERRDRLLRRLAEKKRSR